MEMDVDDPPFHNCKHQLVTKKTKAYSIDQPSHKITRVCDVINVCMLSLHKQGPPGQAKPTSVDELRLMCV